MGEGVGGIRAKGLGVWAKGLGGLGASLHSPHCISALSLQSTRAQGVGDLGYGRRKGLGVQVYGVRAKGLGAKEFGVRAKGLGVRYLMRLSSTSTFIVAHDFPARLD